MADTSNNNSANVTAGKPKATGAIWVAAKGTTLPTDATTDLTDKFECLGYVSEDGVTDDVTKTVNKHKEWGGNVVFEEESGQEETFKYKLIEVLNTEVLKFAFGDDCVSVDSSTGLITVKKKAGANTEKVVVIETVLANKTAKRIVIPRAFLSALGTISYKPTELTGLDCTVDAMCDSEGNSSIEYIKPSTNG